MKKAVITAVAVTLALCLAVGGTLAYLVATSGPVTNTFTVGDITITLSETTGESGYKVVPGGTQAKNPKVTVKANSEDCYVYVCIENNLIIDGKVVVTYDIDTDKWEKIAGDDAKALYRYKGDVKLSAADQDLPVFNNVSYSKDILKTNIQTLKDKTIVLNAYAHQSANIEQSVADTAAKTQFGF
jgi:hypothetical protein